jgi:hypothetical protein
MKLVHSILVAPGRTEDNKPTDAVVDWLYPADGSTLTITPCHLRVIDGLRISFDFTAHEWVIKQELYTDNITPGEWVEVARISGNGPGLIES